MKRKNKQDRFPIPPDVKLRLWVEAAGYCEYPGCNDFLLRDGLTLSRANFSNIAHIVSWTPAGPRGDEKRSAKLATDFTNLMLMCQKHAKLIDTDEKKFDEKKLRTWKKDHEDKVKLTMGKYGKNSTHCLTMFSKIGGQETSISLDEIKEAVFPRYPENEDGTHIDIRAFSPDRENSVEIFSSQIKASVDSLISEGLVNKIPKHISIFALGPIPLLMYLGYCIGNKIPTDLHQKHRDNQSWTWRKKSPATEKSFSYNLIKPNSNKKNVAVILSLSGKIHPEEIKKALDLEYSCYEISIDNPNRDFLDSKEKLRKFRKLYQQTLAEIRRKHGADCIIHIFPAVPSPIAIACGQDILPKSDPIVHVYDNDKKMGGFKKILTLV